MFGGLIHEYPENHRMPVKEFESTAMTGLTRRKRLHIKG
jgi:hypothetical protein